MVEIKMKIVKVIGNGRDLDFEDLSRKVEVGDKIFMFLIMTELLGSVPVGFVHNPQQNYWDLWRNPAGGANAYFSWIEYFHMFKYLSRSCIRTELRESGYAGSEIRTSTCDNTVTITPDKQAQYKLDLLPNNLDKTNVIQNLK